MKSNFCGILIVTLISFIFSRKYSEDVKNIQRRTDYLNSKMEDITHGLIKHTFAPETGMDCIVNEDIEGYETLYRIPPKNILSYCIIFFFNFFYYSLFSFLKIF